MDSPYVPPLGTSSIITPILYGVYQILFGQGSSLFLVRRLGWGEEQIGGIVAVGSFLAAGISITLGATLIDRIGPRRMALIAGIAAGVTLGVFAARHELWHTAPAVLAILGFASLSNTLFYLSFLVLAMRVSAAEIAATSFALIIASQALGGAFGGWLLGRTDAEGGFTAVYGLAAALLLLAGLVAQGVTRHTGGVRVATPSTAH